MSGAEERVVAVQSIAYLRVFAGILLAICGNVRLLWKHVNNIVKQQGQPVNEDRVFMFLSWVVLDKQDFVILTKLPIILTDGQCLPTAKTARRDWIKVNMECTL